MIEEPESLLDALRRSDEGTWTVQRVPADDVRPFSYDRVRCGSEIIAELLTKPHAELIVLLVNHRAEIIESFELLSEMPSPAAEDWRKRIDTVLSKVSGQDA